MNSSLILRREDAEGSPAYLRGGSFAPLRICGAAVMLIAASSAMGCPVCFGGPTSIGKGMDTAIFFLLSIVGLVQIGFVALFWSFRRRAKELQRHREQFHVINGGAR